MVYPENCSLNGFPVWLCWLPYPSHFWLIMSSIASPKISWFSPQRASVQCMLLRPPYAITGPAVHSEQFNVYSRHLKKKTIWGHRNPHNFHSKIQPQTQHDSQRGEIYQHVKLPYIKSDGCGQAGSRIPGYGLLQQLSPCLLDIPGINPVTFCR